MTAVLITMMLVIANVTGAAMAYPQAARLIRTRNTDGLSGVWAGVSIAMNIWWLTYGMTHGLWGLVPVSAAAAVLYMMIGATLLRTLGIRVLGSMVVGALLLGMAPLPFLLVGGWGAAGIAIGLCYGLQLAPAVVAACRTSDLGGVAPATWNMAWIESAIWLVYGLIVIDGALLAGGVSGTLMASIIVGRLVHTGHRPFQIRHRPWRFA